MPKKLQSYIAIPMIHYNVISPGSAICDSSYPPCSCCNNRLSYGCTYVNTLMNRGRTGFRSHTITKIGCYTLTGWTRPKENAQTGVHRALRPEIHFKLLHIIIKELVPFSKRRGLGHPQKQSPVLSVPEMYMEALLVGASHFLA